MKHRGIDYDIAHPLIRCHADKAGAEVFTLKWGDHDIRVLAYDRDSARNTLLNTPRREIEDAIGAKHD